MAVIVTGGPNVALYPGVIDPRYPIGRWSSLLEGTGDATGGAMSLHLQFRSATDPVLQLAFSVETLSAQQSAVLENVRLNIANFSIAGVEGVAAGLLQNIEVVAGSGFGTLPYPAAELFIGACVRGSAAELQIVFPTNTNLATYQFRAQGQLWLYEGMLDLGGVQPVTSSVPTLTGPSKPVGSLQQVRNAQVRIQQPEVRVQPIAPIFPGPIGQEIVSTRVVQVPTSVRPAPASVWNPPVQRFVSSLSPASRPSAGSSAGPTSFRARAPAAPESVWNPRSTPTMAAARPAGRSRPRAGAPGAPRSVWDPQ